MEELLGRLLAQQLALQALLRDNPRALEFLRSVDMEHATGLLQGRPLTDATIHAFVAQIELLRDPENY